MPVAGTLGSSAASPFQVTFRRRETTVAPRAPMKRIFVVDDNAAIRELVLELVSSFGYAGLGVDDGAELLQLLEESVPDLVVMDVRMPNVDGLEAIRRIRANAGLKNLRVIALTASAMRGDREAGLRSGFDAYLTKPIDPELLQKEIERLLTAP
jgi:CheY-like chemotaxis protein